MRYQGYSLPTGNLDEMESSAYVEIDRDNPAIYCDCSGEPSLTRQEFAAECDINNLMAQYEKTGVISHVNSTPPRYLDLSETPDLQTSLELLSAATSAFMALPASVRRDFDNDAVKFVEFAQNPENLEKMREWGLAPPAAVPEPAMKVEVINPEPSPKPSQA